MCLCVGWHISGVRLEEYFYEKVQGKRPILPVDEGLLGQYMVQAGNQFDANTPYGMSHSNSLMMFSGLLLVYLLNFYEQL